MPWNKHQFTVKFTDVTPSTVGKLFGVSRSRTLGQNRCVRGSQCHCCNKTRYNLTNLQPTHLLCRFRFVGVTSWALGVWTSDAARGTVAVGGVGIPGIMQLASFSASNGLLCNDVSKFNAGFLSFTSSLNAWRRSISEIDIIHRWYQVERYVHRWYLRRCNSASSAEIVFEPRRCDSPDEEVETQSGDWSLSEPKPDKFSWSGNIGIVSVSKLTCAIVRRVPVWHREFTVQLIRRRCLCTLIRTWFRSRILHLFGARLRVRWWRVWRRRQCSYIRILNRNID